VYERWWWSVCEVVMECMRGGDGVYERWWWSVCEVVMECIRGGDGVYERWWWSVWEVVMECMWGGMRVHNLYLSINVPFAYYWRLFDDNVFNVVQDRDGAVGFGNSIISTFEWVALSTIVEIDKQLADKWSWKASQHKFKSTVCSFYSLCCDDLFQLLHIPVSKTTHLVSYLHLMW